MIRKRSQIIYNNLNQGLVQKIKIMYIYLLLNINSNNLYQVLIS
jgi:hypothetical protein